MTKVLVILTVVEVLVLVAVLVAYLVSLIRLLRSITVYLGKIAFGVRAVESQTGSIGPSVLRINRTLTEIEAALGPIASKAQEAAARR